MVNKFLNNLKDAESAAVYANMQLSPNHANFIATLYLSVVHVMYFFLLGRVYFTGRSHSVA